MPPPGNPCVAAALATLFGSATYSDCTVQFILEPRVDRPQKRARLENEGVDRPEQSEDVLGDPLPGHTIVLRYASEWFRAKLDDLKTKAQLADGKQDAADGPGQVGRPVLRVPLSSAEEVPSARAAIRFAYTGKVQAGSIREALEVLRQAGYLQVQNCAAACIELIKAKLSEPCSSADAAAASDNSEHVPQVLDLYACERMWPDQENEPSFAGVLESAKKQLVSHFGDALATLNRPVLREQLLELPACALKALLESDEFGTDTEDSVLLLLATWMQPNYGCTDAAMRERLSRLVRLVQLSRPYANYILPALAQDYAMRSENWPAWFPITWKEAAFFSHYASSIDGYEREGLLEEANNAFDVESAWFSTSPRRHCLPDSNLVLDWDVSQEDLKEAMAELLQTRKDATMLGTFTAKDQRRALARGFEWRPSIGYAWGDSAAGVFLRCFLPDAFFWQGSVFLKPMAVMASLSAKLVVYRGRQGPEREVAAEYAYTPRGAYMGVDGAGWGDLEALPLNLPAADRSVHSLAMLLSAWAEYLHNGSIEGSLTLLPHASEATSQGHA